jgi:hypothetical protein
MQPFAVAKHSKQQPLCNPPLETAASNTYLPAVIAVAMIVGKYEGNPRRRTFSYLELRR